MKKLGFIILILIIIAVLFLVFTSKYSFKLGNVNISINEDKQVLEEKVTNFLEDVEFKDFEKAATYHNKADQEKVNISKLIEDKFMVKPELLDITKYEVTDINIDRSGERAKVKTRTIFKILNTGKVEEMELIFYFHRKTVWYKITDETIEKVPEEINIENLKSIKDEQFSKEQLEAKLRSLNYNQDQIDLIMLNVEQIKDDNWYMELESSL